ncbi:hypothetical protein [Prosthecomicrobium sp. N25]|uniref:hypothetical protein n=1 Tax=Prosthecomicrobium sp. N25 TaxID=3129254 RepID=UPI0030773B19
MGPIGRALGLDDIHALRHVRGAVLFGGAALGLGMVAVVFAALALHAALEPSLGPIGSAAAVAGLAALTGILAGVAATRHARKAQRRFVHAVRTSALATAAPVAAALFTGKLGKVGLIGTAVALAAGFFAARRPR